MIRVSTMRVLDRWLGVPACVLLTILRKFFWRDPPAMEVPSPTRILFVKLAEQGSTVLAAQAIRRAIEKVGAERVYFLAFAENRHILDAMALIPESNVITIKASSLGGTLFGAVRAIRQIRKAGIDAAIDLEFFARSSAALATS